MPPIKEDVSNVINEDLSGSSGRFNLFILVARIWIRNRCKKIDLLRTRDQSACLYSL